MNPFRNIPADRVLLENEYFYVIQDIYPVSEGHMLIISKREAVDYFSLTIKEKESLSEMVESAKNKIEEKHKPDGYNIGMNCGEAAGQTVMHFHCHVIPRYKGDMENPRGGIRHCVEGKGYY